MGSCKTERGGALEVSRAAARNGYSIHPLINPAAVPLMDRLGAQMLTTKHNDDVASWQRVQRSPAARATS
jgi:hypothetical protein